MGSGTRGRVCDLCPDPIPLLVVEPLIDQLVRSSFPHPVAAAWHRVSLSTSSADRIKRLLACLEVLVRVLCVLLLPDYLRGPPDEAVEKTLVHLDRPALGHWVQLLRSLVRALEARESPAPFMPEALAWYMSKGRPSEGAKRLDELVMMRNEEAHGRALSVAEQDERAAELLVGLRGVISELSFLAGYRPFRILTSSLSRRSGFSGRIQFLCGVGAQPEPVQGSWPARLFEEGVYLTNPTGAEVLELSPFMQVMHDPGPREDCVFVLAGTQKQKKLVLKNDSTGTTETKLVTSYDGDVALDAWLERRSSLALWQQNQGASENFGARRAAPESEMLGERFQVRQSLGEGGMATVYLVWDLWDEQQFALKVLHRQIAEDTNFKERFRREARTMKRLRHPYILHIEESGQLDDGRLYLKLPVLLGGTLQDRVKAGANPAPQVERWASQMLSALAYLHDKKVIHRDIKPSNFLLDAEGNCYLADFGIALHGEDVRLTRTLEQMGSVAYMSPEQRRGAGATALSDVYSLGVVVHELLTGREGEVTPGKGLPGELGALVRAMCAEDPSERPTAQQALERLDPKSKTPNGQPVSAVPVSGAPVAVPSAPALAPLELSLVEVAPGVVQMTPGREVTLTVPLWSAGVVSRALWTAVHERGPYVADSVRMDEVTWFDAVSFCIALSERMGLLPAYKFTEPHLRKSYSIDDVGRMLRGLGPMPKMLAIVNHFKTEALSVLQFTPDRLAEVPGISGKEAEEFGRKWDRDKCFIRDAVWDRAAPGWRLPTEAEWALMAPALADGEHDWVWCGDPGGAHLTVAIPLADGKLTDVATDGGTRRVVRGAKGRRALVPGAKEKGLGFRVVRTRT
jgi:hypothetical protein